MIPCRMAGRPQALVGIGYRILVTCAVCRHYRAQDADVGQCTMTALAPLGEQVQHVLVHRMGTCTLSELSDQAREELGRYVDYVTTGERPWN